MHVGCWGKHASARQLGHSHSTPHATPFLERSPACAVVNQPQQLAGTGAACVINEPWASNISGQESTPGVCTYVHMHQRACPARLKRPVAKGCNFSSACVAVSCRSQIKPIPCGPERQAVLECYKQHAQVRGSATAAAATATAVGVE